MSSGVYRFYNRRKDGRKLEDCVTRAISTATGLKYNGVRNLLKLSASAFDCDELCVCCYHHLLEEILCYPVFFCTDGETVEDVALGNRDERVIIRIQGHLTCGIYGEVPDIWDCAQEKAECFWIVD